MLLGGIDGGEIYKVNIGILIVVIGVCVWYIYSIDLVFDIRDYFVVRSLFLEVICNLDNN